MLVPSGKSPNPQEFPSVALKYCNLAVTRHGIWRNRFEQLLRPLNDEIFSIRTTTTRIYYWRIDAI